VARKVVQYNMATARTFSVTVGLMSLNQHLRVWFFLRVLGVKGDKIDEYSICT
jgi:hypothetical protein